VTRIGEIGTTLALTNNYHNISSQRATQGPNGVTTQKTAFFIVTAVKISKSYIKCIIIFSCLPEKNHIYFDVELGGALISAGKC
jgi:hypothetical protein